MDPFSVFGPLQTPSKYQLAALTVSLSAALAVGTKAAEPIAPGELVAPKLEIVGESLIFTVAPSVAGRTYLLQYSDALTGGTWRNLGSAVIGTGNNLVLTTPHTAGTPRRFFRLALDAAAAVPDGFSLIPAGAFRMGPTSGDTDSGPQPVTVTVSAFFIAKYEVTKAKWDEVRTWGGSNRYTDLRIGGGKAGDHPVNAISWFDAVKWCNALSQKDGLTPVYTIGGAVMKTGKSEPAANWSANGYRLPTEAEWEKAARGGVSGKRFPWGSDTISHSQANYYASQAVSYDLSGLFNNFHPTYSIGLEPYTAPVGSFLANGFGLHDMAGNVHEWCWDWRASTYVNNANDPKGAPSGAHRLLRGGSWSLNASYVRAASRYSDTPETPNLYAGFRLVRSFVQ